MYGIIVLIYLLIKSEALGKATAENNTGERYAKDGEYIGCYPLECMEFHYHPVLSESTTPDSCTTSCKEYGFKIAALYNRTECSCSCKQTCLTRLPDGTHHQVYIHNLCPISLYCNYCGLPCKRTVDKFCGGFGASALYAVNLDEESKSICSKTENITDMTDGNNEPDTSRSSVHIAIPISVSVAVFLIIIIVAVILLYRRCRHTQEHEERAGTVTRVAGQDSKAINKQLNFQVVQNRNSCIANSAHYQSLGSKPQEPDLPQEVKEVIYEDPDLERSSDPVAPSELNHIYLVSGQGVPSKTIPSYHADEYHEYNYPDAAKIKLKAYDGASKVDEDGYIVANPQLQNWQNPGGKVYYSSRIHTSKIRGQDDSF